MADIIDKNSLLALPKDILVMLPDFLHNIEDYKDLSSTCRTLRGCMEAATPSQILRLAAAQESTFFRPAPFLLVAATSRELGHWARRSDANELELATKLEGGMPALMGLALEHCGLTMQRIRELHLMRFSIINPVSDVVDKCVGTQWYAHEDFWDGGVSDAYTIHSEPLQTVFHLAIYGELFAPDFEPILNGDTATRRLGVDTRIEYIKYCLPSFETECGLKHDGPVDPRRAIKASALGPYPSRDDQPEYNHNIALTWTMRSSRFKPYWKAFRALVGPDFQDDFDDGWWFDEDDQESGWRQRMWENMLICQGLEGLGMMRPDLRDAWVPKAREWREKIAKLEREPPLTKIDRQATLEYPYLLGDLRICAAGYVLGT